MDHEIEQGEQHSPGWWNLDDEMTMHGGSWTIRDGNGNEIVRFPLTPEDFIGNQKFMDAWLMTGSAYLLSQAKTLLQMVELRDGEAILPTSAIIGLRAAVRNAQYDPGEATDE